MWYVTWVWAGRGTFNENIIELCRPSSPWQQARFVNMILDMISEMISDIVSDAVSDLITDMICDMGPTIPSTLYLMWFLIWSPIWYVIWVPQYLILTVSHNSMLSPICHVIWVWTRWGTFNKSMICYFILHHIPSCYFMWLRVTSYYFMIVLCCLHKVCHIYESGLSSLFPLLVIPPSPFFNVKPDHHEHHCDDVHVISCYFCAV